MTTGRQENWNGMNWIAPQTRLAIYLRDGLACVYCGASIEEGTQLSLDHCIPHSKGGADNRPSNLVTACMKCNQSRGNRPMVKFIVSVAEYTDTEASDIEKRVKNARARSLPRKQARDLIARRGTVKKVLKEGI